MPLSSVVGAQSIVRPGVCTSSTRPASPYDGQVIYETDTDKTLVWNGSAWVYLSTSTANPVGLELIKTQTIGTAVSSVVVSDVFSSTYDNYKIIVAGGVSSANNYATLTLGSTATGYYYFEIYGNYNSTTVSGANASNTTGWADVVGGTADSLNGTFELFSPNLAKNTHLVANGATARTVAGGFMVFGYLANTTQYTSFTLTPGSGTWTGGTVRVYGYKN